MAESSQLTVGWQPKDTPKGNSALISEEFVLHRIVEDEGADSDKAFRLSDAIAEEKIKHKKKNSKFRKKRLRTFINQKDNHSQTALYRATKAGLMECIQLLMANCADPNAQSTKYRLTPLMVAAQLEYTAILEFLVNSGADLSIKNRHGDHALSIACEAGHAECVKLLIASGSPLEQKNKSHQTPLTISSETGHVDCIEMLLAAGADITVFSDSILKEPVPYAAIREGHTEALRLLLEHSPETRAKWRSSSHQKILDAILTFDRLEMLLILISDYKWPIKSTKHFQVLHTATSGHYGSPPVKECLKYLLANMDDFGLDINESREMDYGLTGSTPLHRACEDTQYEMINILFQYGADPDIPAQRMDRDFYTEPATLRHYTPLATCLSSLYLNECEYGCDVPYLICAMKIIRHGCNALLHINSTLQSMFRDFTCTVWCREPASGNTLADILDTSVPQRIGRILLKMLYCAIHDDKQPFRNALRAMNFFKPAQPPNDEEFMSYVNQWGWGEFFEPCTLLQLSRDAVRRCMHRQIEVKVEQLTVPRAVKKFLNLQELDELKEEYIEVFDGEVDDHLMQMNRFYYDRENRKACKGKERPTTVEGFYYMNGFSDNMYSDDSEDHPDEFLWSSED